MTRLFSAAVCLSMASFGLVDVQASSVAPSQIVRWAGTVIDYSASAPISNQFGTFDDPAAALGPADSLVVSLGDLDASGIAGGDDPGSITLQLRGTAFDGPGPDIAVFENASTFGGLFTAPIIFAELGYVEVSSNGSDFARLPSISLNTENDLDTQFGRSFAGVDATNVSNLAGYHETGLGTAFDFADLANEPEVLSGDVDLSAIAFVRIVDIPGDGSFVDSLGNPILDAWHTTGTGGFDLDAIGAINSVPEPGAIALVLLGLSAVSFVQRSKRS